MSRIVRFTCYGTPIPQGSKAQNRHGAMYETNKRLAPWRDNVAKAAAEAMMTADGQSRILHMDDLIAGPVELTLHMYFPRPKHHYGTGKNASVLKPSAPAYVATKPDVDKCLRAILDGITGSILRDDALVTRVFAQKQYGEPARADVTVCSLEEAAA